MMKRACKIVFSLTLIGVMLAIEFGNVSGNTSSGFQSESNNPIQITKTPVPNSISVIPNSNCDTNGHCIVSSVGDWVATNINVQVGHSYRVSYVSDTWTVDYIQHPYVGPEGYDTSVDTAIGFWDYCKYDISLPYATLLGKVGESGNTVAIGRGGTFTSQQAGILYLRINDTNDCQVDNDGFVTVDVFDIQTPPENIPNWTFIYYFAADNDLDSSLTREYFDATYDANQNNNNPNVNLVFFYDGYTSQSRYRSIRANGESELIWKGELNTGDAATLANFVLWAKNEFPAHHYALIINDHGHALGGVAKDEHPSNDLLTPKEFKNALTMAGKVDVLFLHTCLMGNLEIEYDLRGLAEFYVASESIGFVGGFHHSAYIRPISAQTTAEELAMNMAKEYYAYIQSFKLPSTISVVRLPDVVNVAINANNLAYHMRNHDPSTGLVIWDIILKRVQRFDADLNNTDSLDPLADLKHLAIMLEAISDENIASAAASLRIALDEYVLYHRHVSGTWGGQVYNYDNSYGVSIAVPIDKFLFYDYSWLEFAGLQSGWGTPPSQSTMYNLEYIDPNYLYWGGFVSDMVNLYNPQAIIVSEPPLPVAMKEGYVFVHLPLISK